MSTTAGGLSALALSQGLLGNAFAGPSLTKKQRRQIVAAHSAGSERVLDTKLSPQAKRLGKMLLQKSKHAVGLAAANPKTKFAKGTLHFRLAKHVGQLSPKRAARAKQRAAKQLSASTRATTFGPYAKAELASATVAHTVDFDLKALLQELAAQAGTQESAQQEDAPVYKRLEFQLNSVECIEETSEASASDEILLGGHLIERDGNIVKIDQFTVHDDFDEGEIKWYDFEVCDGTVPPPAQIADALCPHGGPDDVYRGRKLASSTLGGPGTWGLVLILAEEDQGGFGDILNDVYTGLKGEIQEALDEAGIAIGKALSAYFGELGEIIGVALAWVVGELLAWFVGLFESADDLIATKTWLVSLEKRKQAYIQKLWKDNLPSPQGTWASPMKKFAMNGDGGRYEMRLHCRAFAS